MAIGIHKNDPGDAKDRGFKRLLPLLTVVAIVAFTLPRQMTNLKVMGGGAEMEYQVQGIQEGHTVLRSSETGWSKYYHDVLANNTIRKWGCHRNETPLFFVHIGKAGGGHVRARFAAAANNYNRANWFDAANDSHFYPVSQHHNGSFCNSMVSNMEYPVPGKVLKSFEGSYSCVARSPISSAIGCPDPKIGTRRCMGCRDITSRHCHTVYAGHNYMGGEMNLLPAGYLEDWWRSTPWGQQFKVDWRHLHWGNTSWCKEHKLGRPVTKGQYGEAFQKCQKTISEELDQRFEAFWPTTMVEPVETNSSVRPMFNYAPIYASLPVHRVTIIREPFSWLVSKFSWHAKQRGNTCDDIAQAARPPPNQGWAFEFCLVYVLYLCGQDCAIRYDSGLMSLEELEVQATMNLRNSFSVVGLLNESDVFYDMVSTRIGYIDMSLNAHVQGKQHQSTKSAEIRRCAQVFADKGFQANFTAQFPLFGVLQRLYEVGLEVNRFQMQELRECSGSRVH